MATKKTTTKAAKTVKKQTPKNPKNPTTIAWNNIFGVMRVWATERTHKKKTWLSFSTSIGKKNDDGEYDNIYFDVLFKKNEAPEVGEGAFEIIVKKGFLTFTTYNDGSIHPAVMVMEYDLKDDEDEDEDEDIPF